MTSQLRLVGRALPQVMTLTVNRANHLGHQIQRPVDATRHINVADYVEGGAAAAGGRTQYELSAYIVRG